MDKKKEIIHLEYYKNGVDYANTFHTTANKLEKGGMLKNFMGLDKIPNENDKSDFLSFMDKAKMNANNLCVRDLNERRIPNAEEELKAFMLGFEKTLSELIRNQKS